MSPRTPSRRLEIRDGLLFDGAAESPAERQAGKRQLRKGQILGLLRTSGPLSRVEIARALAFNLRSVSLLVDELVAEQLVLEQEGRRTASGRRPIPVALNPAAACVLGMDVGRSSTAAALMDLQGNLLARTVAESNFSADPREQAGWVADLAARFLAGQKKGDLPPLAGMALAADGLVHRQQLPQRLADAAEPVRARLETLLGVPVFSGSDSHFLALGEQWFGQARGVRHAAVFNLTDGLGLGVIIDGKLLSGSRGWAGEIGHVPLGEAGIPCFCGSTSCLENIVSGSGLVRMAKEEGLLAGRRAAAGTVAELARKGSLPARRVFDRFARGLALAATLVIDLHNPEVVVFGGSLASCGDLFLETVNTELDRLAVPYIRAATRVCVSELGEDAVLLGACAAVLNQIYDTSHVAVETLL